jgi:hypothetical protein
MTNTPCRALVEADVRSKLGLIIVLLLAAAAAFAQDGLTVSANANPQVRDVAHKIYVAACLTAEREFGATHPVKPKVILVLGADKDTMNWEQGEVRLRKWNPYLFIQGVIALAYRELMPLHVNSTAKDHSRKMRSSINGQSSRSIKARINGHGGSSRNG